MGMETEVEGCVLDHLAPAEREELERTLTRVLDIMVTPEPSFQPRYAA